MLENTNIKQFYPGPILNKTLDITGFLFKDPEQVHITYTYKNEDGSLNNRELAYGTEYEVVKILPSDVTQADAALTASAGKVTLKTDINVALGERLTIYRESEIIQETQYPRTGPFPAASHEGALDYLTMQNQEQQDQIDRSLKVPISTANFDGSLPIPVPARALKINNSGSGFEFSVYDPDTALETTKEYMESAQTAASSALASQNAAASSASSAANSEIVAIEQTNIATEQANIATEQATIATNKTSEVVASGNDALSNIDTAKNNAITSITNQETTSKNALIDEGAIQVGLIQNEGATQVANVQSTGFYMRDDKLYFINSQGEETEFKSGGSGLEICDIGMALYVDETKGLRRYLNGQIVDINANTQAFLNRLQQITTLHPSLLCTEEEWQTAKTMSAFGQVGKFVFNYSGEDIVSVRLPRVVNVQGLFDLQNLGMTVGQALPSHTHTRGTMNITGGFTSRGIENINMNGWGAFNAQDSTDGFSYGHDRGKGGGFNFDASRSWTGSTSAPNYSGTVATGAVQQEAIQYPYFIQIATGSETENNIINDIELNNPSFFGDSKYVPTKVNNLSWLKSEGQNNPKGTYPSFYDWILENVNKGEKGFKLSTATDITDYDFVINTADETFRLPLLNGSEDLIGTTEIRFDSYATSNTFNYTAPQNGHINIIFSCGEAGDWVSIHNETAGSTHIVRGSYINAWENVSMDVKRGDVLKIECDNTAKDKGFFFYPFVGNGSLYYYVGETVQNANLIDAGRIGEILPTKTDMLQASGAGMPSNRYIDLATGADGSTYIAPANGWFVFGRQTNNPAGCGLFNQTTGIGCSYVIERTWHMYANVPAKKGDVVAINYWQGNSTTIFRFIYAEGEI